jgi:hypothetical protein
MAECYQALAIDVVRRFSDYDAEPSGRPLDGQIDSTAMVLGIRESPLFFFWAIQIPSPIAFGADLSAGAALPKLPIGKSNKQLPIDDFKISGSLCRAGLGAGRLNDGQRTKIPVGRRGGATCQISF